MRSLIGGNQRSVQHIRQEAAGGVVDRTVLGQRRADILAGNAQTPACLDKCPQVRLRAWVCKCSRSGQNIAGERRNPDDAPIGNRHRAGGDRDLCCTGRIADSRLSLDCRLIRGVNGRRHRAARQGAPEAVLLRAHLRQTFRTAAVVINKAVVVGIDAEAVQRQDRNAVVFLEAKRVVRRVVARAEVKHFRLRVAGIRAGINGIAVNRVRQQAGINVRNVGLGTEQLGNQVHQAALAAEGGRRELLPQRIVADEQDVVRGVCRCGAEAPDVVVNAPVAAGNAGAAGSSDQRHIIRRRGRQIKRDHVQEEVTAGGRRPQGDAVKDAALAVLLGSRQAGHLKVFRRRPHHIRGVAAERLLIVHTRQVVRVGEVGRHGVKTREVRVHNLALVFRPGRDELGRIAARKLGGVHVGIQHLLAVGIQDRLRVEAAAVTAHRDRVGLVGGWRKRRGNCVRAVIYPGLRPVNAADRAALREELIHAVDVELVVAGVKAAAEAAGPTRINAVPVDEQVRRTAVLALQVVCLEAERRVMGKDLVLQVI